MSLSDRYTTKLERVAGSLANWQLQLRNRRVLLVIFIALTAFFGYHATQIKLDAGYEKSIPADHPYMEVYRAYAPQFGGANIVNVALMSKEGDIFNPRFLSDLDALTRDVMRLPGVIPSFVRSLFTADAVFVTYNEEGFAGGRIVPPEFVPNDTYVELVRQNLLKSGEVGRLVSRDFQGAMVIAEFSERDPQSDERLDYRKLGSALEALRDKYTTEDTDLRIIGFPKFIDDVIDGVTAVGFFFLVALTITACLLYLYSGSWALTGAALFVALDAVVWQLGLSRLLGLGIDPMSILVPFLIFSIGVSHAVQMTNAWRMSVVAGETSIEAARSAFRRVFIPGTTALLANAVGFGVIMVIRIPIIHELGIIAAIGVAVMVITNKFLLPILLADLKLSPRALQRAARAANRGEGHVLWHFVSACARRKVAIPILIVGVVILGCGVWARQHVVVGDAVAGAPELRPGSRYNRDIREIGARFNVNMDQVTVIARTHKEGCADFKVMYPIDRYQWLMAHLPGVQSVEALPGVIRQRNVGNSEGSFKFYELPRNPHSFGDAMRYMEFNLKLFDQACTAIPIRIYTKDHRAETLANVISETKRFQQHEAAEGVEFLSAAGSGGVMAATNEAVKAAQNQMLVTLYLAVTVLCLATFASWRMAFCVVVPLVLVSQFAEAVMYWLDIGLKVSTLPVVALGAGVGVDYGIYLLSRTQVAMRDGLRLREAYLRGLREAGTAVVFTAVTMTLGVATWVLSPLKFQADMGLLLAYMFIVNMLGAVILMPALASVIVYRAGFRGGSNSWEDGVMSG